MSLLNRAKALRKTLSAELIAASDELRSKMLAGEVVTPAVIKAWRRGWVDRAVEIRDLAKESGNEDEQGHIREQAQRVERLARDHEGRLLPDAHWLAEAQSRGGILTAQQRASRAREQRKVSRTFHCSQCGSPLPERAAEACEYCETPIPVQTQQAIASGAAGLAGLDESKGVAWPHTAQEIYDFGRSTLDALHRSFVKALAAEKEGILLVLDAGKKRTEAFYHACEDADERLERHWQHLRRFGMRASDRLDDLEAHALEQKLDDELQRILDTVSTQKRSMLDAVQSRARLEWDRNQRAGVDCPTCGSNVEPPYGFTGEMRCPHCDAMITVGAHLTQHDIEVNKKIDAKVAEQRSAKEELEHWKSECLMGLTPENVEHLRKAAIALYDKQLSYIKDGAKRAAQVERSVAKILAEVGA